MPIPPLDNDGYLPPGIHDATLAQVEEAFGQRQSSDRRARLFGNLRRYLQELLAWGQAREVILNGSFVTAKPDPGDIDLLVVLEPGFDFAAPVTPAEYNLLNHTRAKQVYGFDVFTVPEGSPMRDGVVEMFSRDSRRGGAEKGILRLAQ
jgi:hypothetical protein